MKKIFIYLISLFLIILIFELLNGFWFKSELEKNLLNLNALYKVDLQLDSNDFYENSKTISYSRNNYGLRTNCQRMADIDLVSIGGSTTDQRYIDFENTFSFILQQAISKNKDSTYCIANAGVDGHKLSDHIISFNDWFPLIPSLKPNYYLLNIGINDAAILNDISIKNISATNNFISYAKFQIIRNSYLYSFIKKIRNLVGISLDHFGVLTHKKNIKSDFEYTALKNSTKLKNDIIKNSETFGTNFRKMITIIKNKGATPICISQVALFVKNSKGINKAFPYKNNFLNGLDLQLSLDLINNQIMEICADEGGIIVNVDNSYFIESDFYDFVHHNPQGSRKLAKKIYYSIKDKL